MNKALTRIFLLLKQLISTAIVELKSCSGQLLLANRLESPDNWLIYNYFIVYIITKVKVRMKLIPGFCQLASRRSAMLKNETE